GGARCAGHRMCLESEVADDIQDSIDFAVCRIRFHYYKHDFSYLLVGVATESRPYVYCHVYFLYAVRLQVSAKILRPSPITDLVTVVTISQSRWPLSNGSHQRHTA